MTESSKNSLNSSQRKSPPGSKRIFRATDKEELIQELLSEQIGIFKEIWRVMLFAAMVGYKNGRREPLKNVESGKGIDQATFGNCPAWPGILYLMALVVTQSSDSLSGSQSAEDLRVAAFQEYANGGLTLIRDFFGTRVLDLDGFLSFIDSQIKNDNYQVDLNLSI
ncbi:DNA phosphorothioation-associated protein 4 [Desulfonatronum thioautotrophicum]|uniref:DNA phosphorothioation-associated protein 4 n=1 Tax=Desulfonatronum thioautotrophicum TaxID=617001 RepID=UPI001294678D|nr:DNA phosphorothioation-associated protein 4 [Desulfonatronum thioautotrophicum]